MHRGRELLAHLPRGGRWPPLPSSSGMPGVLARSHYRREARGAIDHLAAAEPLRSLSSPLASTQLFFSSTGERDTGFNDDEWIKNPFPKTDTRMRTRTGILLPEGWAEHRSSAKGIYYSHTPTGITQWNMPREQPTKEQIAAHHQATYGDQISQLKPGKEVILRGLIGAPQLNGKYGTFERWDHTTGRVRVRLKTGELKAVKPEFLVSVDALNAKEATRRWFEEQAAKEQAARKQSESVGEAPTGNRWLQTGPQKVAALLVSGSLALWASHEYNRAKRLEQRASSASAAAA
eukprot:TRINITY_DN20274_c0_g1_i1.p1 TRINITY_DN20274_c0_g1~~TRINITY_DN20274_c0_g1_i1.p1  ORF type:complete len:291 (+),score=30.37 TRINITY_DN20274_c0_g1_i1:222-1094(+)